MVSIYRHQTGGQLTYDGWGMGLRDRDDTTLTLINNANVSIGIRAVELYSPEIAIKSS